MFDNKLKKVRKEIRETQQKTASFLHISQTYYAKIEKQERIPSDYLFLLAKHWKHEVTDLYSIIE